MSHVSYRFALLLFSPILSSHSYHSVCRSVFSLSLLSFLLLTYVFIHFVYFDSSLSDRLIIIIIIIIMSMYIYIYLYIVLCPYSHFFIPEHSVHEFPQSGAHLALSSLRSQF